MPYIVIVRASNAGQLLVIALSPNLPSTNRILMIDPALTSYWSIASLRAAVVPGLESKVYHKLEQNILFVAGSKNVLVRRKVVKLQSKASAFFCRA